MARVRAPDVERTKHPYAEAMTGASLRIVVAPDSLKGSCTATTAARAIADGVREVLGAAAHVREIPLADGGEGTLDALTAVWGGSVQTTQTTDALGRARAGRWGLSADGTTAIVEAAEANGLPLVADVPLRAQDADSAGVGTLIRAALDAGATELLVCVGGSATSDGGAGMLRALGGRLLTAAGTPIPPGAHGLLELDSWDLSELHPAAATARWRFAVDVTNPLLGERGAAAVFGPQKGAGVADVSAIEVGLRRLSRLVVSTPGVSTERDPETTPGLGAAGGLPLVPVLLWGAELTPGADLVASAAGLDAALTDADVVFVAEGRLDRQSLEGKVLSRVLAGAQAAPQAPRVVVLAGEVDLSAAECRAAGITAALSLAAGPADLEALQLNTRVRLRETAAQVAALLRPVRSA